MDPYLQIEQDFLLRFPGGLEDPHWLELGKKHRSIAQVIQLCQQQLSVDQLAAAMERRELAAVSEACRQLIGRCTTVSTFEKMAFRNYLGFSDVHLPLTQALHALYADFGPDSFASFVDTLALCRHDGNADAAKWPVVTAFLAYRDPERHVCIKPTTIKKVAARLGVDIGYRPRPDYDCYRRVQDMVATFRQRSPLAAGQNNIIAQAIMYCTV